MTLGANFNYLRSQERHYIQPVDEDDEFEALLAEFQMDQPQWTADVTDPAYRALKMMASIKAFAVNYANGLVRSSSPSHAIGDAIDDMGALVQLPRRTGETDERYLERVLIEPVAREGGVGSQPNIVSNAFKADDDVFNVQAVGKGNGYQVDVWFLSNETQAMGTTRGTPSAATIARVSDYINDDRRKITDHEYIVAAPTITTFTITAALTYNSERHDATGVINRARERINEFVKEVFAIGEGVSKEEIETHLQGLDRDVISVTLTAPANDLAATDGTAYLCEPNDTDITITATAA